MKKLDVRKLSLSYGFLAIMTLVFIAFSVMSPTFLGVSNLMAILHAAAPLMVTASGLALVVIGGKIDLSVGSIAYLATGVCMFFSVKYGFPLPIALLLIPLVGVLLGAVNGFIIVVMRVNPLITTLGMFFVFRGIALSVTNAMMIGMPEQVRLFSQLKIGPVFVDVIVALVILAIVHVLHSRTVLGRHVTAIGNGGDIAARLGVRTQRVAFLTFMLSGMLASIGGMLSMSQVGAISSFTGAGLEFTAVAAIVIGGISLFGGEGKIIPNVLLGGLVLIIVENGLHHLGADPFAYRFAEGGVIFLAMYADSLKSRVRTKVQIGEMGGQLPTGAR